MLTYTLMLEYFDDTDVRYAFEQRADRIRDRYQHLLHRYQYKSDSTVNLQVTTGGIRDWI